MHRVRIVSLAERRMPILLSGRTLRIPRGDTASNALPCFGSPSLSARVSISEKLLQTPRTR